VRTDVSVNAVIVSNEFDLCMHSTADTCGSVHSGNVVIDFNEFNYNTQICTDDARIHE